MPAPIASTQVFALEGRNPGSLLAGIWPACYVLIMLLLALSGCRSESIQPTSPTPAYHKEYRQDGLEIAVSLDRDHLSMSQTATLTVAVTSPEEQAPAITLADNENLPLGRQRTTTHLLDNNRLETRLTTVILPFLPGSYQLAGIAIGPAEHPLVTLDAIPISVSSVTKSASEFNDILPPRPLSANPWIWPLAGLAALLVITAGLFWYHRRRQRQPRANPAPPLPPHKQALQALDRLLANNHLGRGELACFQAALADIVRHYLEQRFQLRAPEQTCEEFLRDNRTRAVLTTEQRLTLEQFLLRTDLIKFARRQPTIKECEAALDDCRNFILETATGSATAQGGTP